MTAPCALTDALRPVVAERPLVDPVIRGALPHLGWVDIAKLRIDDRYQRPLQRHNWDAIARIAKNFDWALFTVVDIAPVGEGLYCVIDGQHRVHAALMAGVVKVPVRIVSALLEGQARAFMGINGNVTAITPFHVLRASLAAGTPWAVEADRAIARAGCRLMVSNASTDSKLPGEIYATQWVRGLAERDGEVNRAGLAALELALASLKQSTQGAANPLAWTHVALRAWHGAVAGLDDWIIHPSACRALTGFLNSEDLLALLSAATDRKQQAKRDGRPCAAIAALLLGDLQTRLEIYQQGGFCPRRRGRRVSERPKGLHCPGCGKRAFRTTDSRPVHGGTRRRRECVSCDYRVSTLESIVHSKTSGPPRRRGKAAK